jgi:hypothetical protein
MSSLPILQEFSVDNIFTVDREHLMYIVAFKIDFPYNANISIILRETTLDKSPDKNIVRNQEKINRPNSSYNLKDFDSTIIYIPTFDRNKWLTYTDYEESGTEPVTRLYRLNSSGSLKFSDNISVSEEGNYKNDAWGNWLVKLTKGSKYKFIAKVKNRNNDEIINSVKIRAIIGDSSDITDKVYNIRKEFTKKIDIDYCSLPTEEDCPYFHNDRYTRLPKCMNWNKTNIIGRICKGIIPPEIQENISLDFCKQHPFTPICDCINMKDSNIFKKSIKENPSLNNISKFEWYSPCKHPDYLKDFSNSENNPIYKKTISTNPSRRRIFNEDDDKIKSSSNTNSRNCEGKNRLLKEMFGDNNNNFLFFIFLIMIIFIILICIIKYKNNTKEELIYKLYTS